MKNTKKVTDNFSDFLDSYDVGDIGISGIGKTPPAKEQEITSRSEQVSDNFSTFLTNFDGPIDKVSQNLDGISKAITSIKAGAEDTEQLKQIVEAINKGRMAPIATAMQTVTELNRVSQGMDRDHLKANSSAYKTIVKNYIDIAKQTSDNNIANQTIDLSKNIIF